MPNIHRSQLKQDGLNALAPAAFDGVSAVLGARPDDNNVLDFEGGYDRCYLSVSLGAVVAPMDFLLTLELDV